MATEIELCKALGNLGMPELIGKLGPEREVRYLEGKGPNPKPTDKISIHLDLDTGMALDGLEAIRLKLVEIEQQAERTASALSKLKI